MTGKCRIVGDLLPLYADNVCSDESRRLVERHASGCAECKKKLEAMTAQLPEAETKASEIKQGNVSEQELAAAKSGVASDLRATVDSQGALEGFYLSQTLLGLDYGPMEMAELAGQVTADDVARIANSVECDLIYFMSGSDSEEDENGED